MKTPFAAVAIATAALLGLPACSESPSDDSTAEAPDAPATTASSDAGRLVGFELPDMHGTVRQSSEWDGRPMLLNFWATWCAPCRREIPLLKASQEKYTDLDLQVIGIAVDFAEDVVAYAEEAQFNYPVLVGQEDAMAVAEKSGVEFIGLPFTMVVAPTGELVATHIGEIVEEHIVRITDVLAKMESGHLDVDGARAELHGL